MNRRQYASALATLLSASLLCACGSGSTQTVSVANTETPPPPTSATISTSALTTSTAASTTSSVVSASASQSAPASTRTASAPAFVTTSSGPATGAAAVLAVHGYSPVGSSALNGQDTLQVVVGSRQVGSGQKAFFFVNGRYIGTDTALPSGQISVVDTSDTEVTLGYALVHPDGSSAGTAEVRYALNNGMLGPLDPIPSASPSAPVSRR